MNEGATIEITTEKFLRMYEALMYVISNPDAAQGCGDIPHAKWAKMQRLAKEALIR